MSIPICIQVNNLAEAGVAVRAIESYRSQGEGQNETESRGTPVEPDSLADRIYAALSSPTFTKPSQVVTRVLLAAHPTEQVPVSAITAAFVKEGLANSEQQAWNRARAAFATLSWLMDQRLDAQDKLGVTKPIDVFAVRALDEKGKRTYRLSRAGRSAAERFFKDLI